MASDAPSWLAPPIAQYADDHSAEPDELQRRLIAETAALGRASGMQISPLQGTFMEMLVRATCIPHGEDEIPGAWGLWFDLWARAFRHPEVAKDRVELDQRWRDTIAGVVRDGQQAGQIGRTVDAEAFAITFSALLDGLSIQVALADPVVDAERAFAIAMAFAARELGVGWRPRRSSVRSAGRVRAR